MPYDKDEIRIFSGGMALAAPKGTAAPTDLTTDWPSGWVELGYLTDDGLSYARNPEIGTVTGWPSREPLRRYLQRVNEEWSFAMQQWNRFNFTYAMGGGTWTTTGTGAATVHKYVPPASNVDLTEYAFGFEAVDGSRIHRWIVASTVVTNLDDIQFRQDDPSPLAITLGIVKADGVDPWVRLSNDPADAAVA